MEDHRWHSVNDKAKSRLDRFFPDHFDISVRAMRSSVVTADRFDETTPV
jgi:hypothetical protein